MIFALILFITWLVAFMGAYMVIVFAAFRLFSARRNFRFSLQQNRHVIGASIVLWTLFIVIWIYAVLLSYYVTNSER